MATLNDVLVAELQRRGFKKRKFKIVDLGKQIADNFRNSTGIKEIPTKEIIETHVVNDYPDDFIPVIKAMVQVFLDDHLQEQVRKRNISKAVLNGWGPKPVERQRKRIPLDPKFKKS